VRKKYLRPLCTEHFN